MPMMKWTIADRARLIADRAVQVARDRAANEWPGDWTSRSNYDDFVYMLRSMEATVDGPLWQPTVELAPRMRRDGGCWAYTAYEILESAAGRVDAEAGDQHTFDHGHFDTDGEDNYAVRLAWDHKPNLDRVYTADWDTPPMVSLTLDGQVHVLDAIDQDTAAEVAYRYPARHLAWPGQRYARALLRLADSLGTDTVTAQRVAEIAAPERERSVDAERNPALRILSVDEEKHARLTRPGNGHGPLLSCPECGAAAGEMCRVPGCSGTWW